MIDDAYAIHVALGTTADAAPNTLVLAGIDLEIPLEADLADDPLHDDQVLLEGIDGSRRILGVGDPDVRLDTDRRLYLYRFRGVPVGIYALSVGLSDGIWAPVLSGIVVKKDGAHLGETALADRDAPAVPADAPAGKPGAEEEAPGEDAARSIVDVTPDVFVRR